MLGLAIFVISAALMAVQFKGMKNEFSIYVVLAASIVVIFFAVAKLKGIVDMVDNISKITNIGEGYIEILLKITGITYLSEFSANICTDCGYSSLSEQIRIFGKISVMSISVPIINNLIEIIGGFYV